MDPRPDSQEPAQSLGSEQRTCLVDSAWYAGDVVAGRYRLQALIAEGGMGLVFRAHHLILDQPIALKLVRPMIARHPIAVARFLDEARVIARLKSPHVVHVFDSGTAEDDTPYMALELLNGWDLHSVLELEGSLSFELAAKYVMQACHALAEAHSLGIVHRDLKPENLFLHHGADDVPMIKVLDFGISKHLHRGDGRSHTIEGETIGSPHYMAPEQMAAKEVDARADIWSLGVVLFELVTGRLPFAGENIAQVYSTLFSDEVPAISSFRSNVPLVFERIVQRCLRKDPAERYGRVDEVAQALGNFLSGAASPPSDVSERPTMISVAPGAETKKSAQVTLLGIGQIRWNSGWALLSLMVVLILGGAVGKRLGLPADLSGGTFELHSAVTAGAPASTLAGNTVSAPVPVNAIPLDAAQTTSVLPAPSVELSPTGALPSARPLPGDGQAQRLAAMRAWNAWKARTTALAREAPKSGVPRASTRARASIDELIPPYGDPPELRAEVNDAKR